MPVGLTVIQQQYPGIDDKLCVGPIIPADMNYVTSPLLLGKVMRRPDEARAPESNVELLLENL